MSQSSATQTSVQEQEYEEEASHAAKLTHQEVLFHIQNSKTQDGTLRPMIVEGGVKSAFEIACEAFGESQGAGHIRLAIERDMIKIDGELSNHRTPRQLYDRLGEIAAALSKQGKAAVLSVEGIDLGEFWVVNSIRAHALEQPSVFIAMVFSASSGAKIPHALKAMSVHAVIGPLCARPVAGMPI